MAKAKDLKVNSIVICNNLLLQVIENNNSRDTCNKCHFKKVSNNAKSNCDLINILFGECKKHFRKDKNNIIFKKVKIMENNKTTYITINSLDIEKYLNHERYEECIVNSFTGEILVPEDLYNKLNK